MARLGAHESVEHLDLTVLLRLFRKHHSQHDIQELVFGRLCIPPWRPWTGCIRPSNASGSQGTTSLTPAGPSGRSPSPCPAPDSLHLPESWRVSDLPYCESLVAILIIPPALGNGLKLLACGPSPSRTRTTTRKLCTGRGWGCSGRGL